MALTGNPIDLYQRKYSDLILHELQQQGSVLEGCVSIEPAMGERTYINRIGASDTAAEVTSRFADIVPDMASFERRFITPRTISDAKFVDHTDLVRGSNPTSDIVKAVVMGMGRKKDALIFSAFGSAASREVAGVAGTVSFTSGNTIAVDDNTFAASTLSGNTGLHEGKLSAAINILEGNYVSAADEDIFVIGTSLQLTKLVTRLESLGELRRDMLGDNSLKIPGLFESLGNYRGLKFIKYEPLKDAANLVSSNQYVYVMAKSAIKLGIWNEASVKLTVREDKQGFPVQIYAMMDIGAVRMDEAKIVRLICTV
jgi:hypothetical protein